MIIIMYRFIVIYLFAKDMKYTVGIVICLFVSVFVVVMMVYLVGRVNDGKPILTIGPRELMMGRLMDRTWGFEPQNEGLNPSPSTN